MYSGDEGIGINVAPDEVAATTYRAHPDVTAAHADEPVKVEVDSCFEIKEFQRNQRFRRVFHHPQDEIQHYQ